MSEPAPHDTTYNPGAALAVAIVGFVLLLIVFAVPYFLDESWYTTPRTVTYAVVQGKPVRPSVPTPPAVPVVSVVPVMPVAPRPPPPPPPPYEPGSVWSVREPRVSEGVVVAQEARRPNLSGLA